MGSFLIPGRSLAKFIHAIYKPAIRFRHRD